MWRFEAWAHDYVVIYRNEIFTRFPNHAKARAFVHGMNSGLTTTEARILAERETSSLA